MAKFHLPKFAILLAICAEAAYAQGQSSGVNTQRPSQQTSPPVQSSQAAATKTNSSSIQNASNATGSASVSAQRPQGNAPAKPVASGSGQTAQSDTQNSGAQTTAKNDSTQKPPATSTQGNQPATPQNRVSSNDDFKSDTAATGRINDRSSLNSGDIKDGNESAPSKSDDAQRAPEK